MLSVRLDWLAPSSIKAGEDQMVLNLPFVVHEPPELREALLPLAEQMVQRATAQ